MSIEMVLAPVITLAIGWLTGRLRTKSTELIALKSGLQAILRDRLIQSYKYFESKGYASFEDRQNFENMYTQYHNLGSNGVMDDIRDKFMELPTYKKEVD